MTDLSFFDTSIIYVYFFVVLLIGLMVSSSKEKTAEDYFLAGRNLSWLMIGVSLFATNISSEHIVGLAGAAYSKGLVLGHFEWLAIIFLLLLGWFIGPLFFREKVLTVPEFFGKRFGNRVRVFLSLMSVITYFFTKTAVTLLTAGFLLNKLLGWDFFASALILVLITGLYTIAGGLISVVRTQIFQTAVFLGGSLIVVIYSLHEIGGISELIKQIPAERLNLFKPMSDAEIPWTGLLFGAPVLAIWYWLTDQYIMQRILGAKNINEIKKGTILASLFKLLPVVLFMFPGLIALLLLPSVGGNEAYGSLVAKLNLPDGVRGLIISGLFAALMSSLASVFNSSSTLIANDLYKPFRPQASDRTLILVARLSAIGIVLITIGLIPVVKMIKSDIYLNLQMIQSYISPPVAAVFVFVIFNKKLSGRAVFSSLIFGMILASMRIISHYTSFTVFMDISFLNTYFTMNYLHFSALLFILTGMHVLLIMLAEKYSFFPASGFTLMPNFFNHAISNQDIKTK
ncbi:MAG: sodium/solute symporter [Ignavibacteriales bacterium]|nr:sodium/solute symporter [Ignavibacteriales bacterium]MCF8307005.1 sodium/solute symporter [Ignavibacteriales bacterium]MCF8438219.1 sodium/solute symporter [Ignavibacteriales bacterium]